MRIDDDDAGLTARLNTIELRIADLARRLGERKRPRDGQRVLSVRAGDDRIARVHEAARRRGCTLSAIMNEAIDYVTGPSTHQFPDSRGHPPAFMPRTLPRDATRQAITANLTEQRRLPAAGAATMTDRRSRDERRAQAAGMLAEGMLTEGKAPGLLRGR
jgi:hypothetical protein